jgi:hypothetical protein
MEFRVSRKSHFAFKTAGLLVRVKSKKEMRNACKNLAETPERHRRLGNPRCRWKGGLNSSESYRV